MSEWKEYKLGDVIQFGNGKERPRTNGDIPVFGGNGILDYCNQSNYSGETIIIGRVGAYCGSVFFQDKPIWVSDNALAAKPKGNFQTKFLYYFLKNLGLNTFAEGSSHPLVTQTLLNSIDVFISDNEDEQKSIAETLSGIDDKIDLLQRQNKTLEQLAETLFRQWFVEETEESWEVGKLGDLISIYDNKRIPVSSMERAKMKTGELYPYYGAATIMDYVNQYIFDGEYILMGEDGTVQTENGFPVLQLPTGKFWVNNHTHIFQANPPFSNYFIYTFLKLTNISGIVTGAVQPKINQEALKRIEFVIPPKNKIELFVETGEQFWQKTKSNTNQIETLTKLRDSLLPKLMSGVIRINMN